MASILSMSTFRVVVALMSSLAYISSVSALNPQFAILTWATLPADLQKNPLIFSQYNQTFLDKLLDTFPGGHIANVSGPCYEDTTRFLADIFNLKLYALQMVDAFFKPPPGLSDGNILMLGAYDLCLEIKGNSSYKDPDNWYEDPENSTELVQLANYCLVRLELVVGNNTSPLPPLATCLPKSCSPADVDKLMLAIVHSINYAKDKVRPAGNTACDEPIPPQKGTTATLILLGGLAVICLFATAVHLLARTFDHRYWLWHAQSGLVIRQEITQIQPKLSVETLPQTERQLSEASDRCELPTGGESVKVKVPGYIKLVLCFSIVENTNRLLAPSAPGQMDYLNGIRVLSMWWVMLGHVHHLGATFFGNRGELVELMKGFPQQLILNANLGVDTFFLLSGLVMTYSLLRKVEHSRYKRCAAPLLLSYVRRLYRLTPLYGAILLVYMYVVPYLGGGPFTILIRQEGSPTESCKNYWWTNLLYVSNFLPEQKDKMCMNWTWFLSADMQLFMLTPPVIAVLIKCPKLGMGLLGALLTACIVAVSGLVTIYGLPLTVMDLQASLPTSEALKFDYDYNYDKPWLGGINYIVGMALAVLLAKRRSNSSKIRWNIGIFVFGWAISFVLAYFAIFGLYYGGLDTPVQMTLSRRWVYAALARPAWAVAIGWVIFACQFDYGFAVKSFLSQRIWTPLSRLTYAAFLIHFIILQSYFTSLRAMLNYSTYEALSIFFSQVVAVYAVAYLAFVVIEMPLRQLGRINSQSTYETNEDDDDVTTPTTTPTTTPNKDNTPNTPGNRPRGLADRLFNRAKKGEN
ncbi:putative Nose resistant to fluoxetine protein 6 [Hypsibius exemplaris]|uniref:Nose resistant to fluoxetine protein 6 n=1 Tax=Hypsibius exemplaris TaxID=2072580 RepID=A0A1W0X2D9_HYPEX|nr:putative Nose resistant to fluoxetine protein 6 [Hypsibius exemplaris]